MHKKTLSVIGVGILFIALMVTAGCTNRGGWADATKCCPSCSCGINEKTSVVIVETTIAGTAHITDENGIDYYTERWGMDKYDHHNITFRYKCDDGYLYLTEVVSDHTECSCQRSCSCSCNYQPCDCQQVKCGCGC